MIAEDQTVANYRLNESKFNNRVTEFWESAELATLRGELALAKALLEDRINAATTPGERAASVPAVRDLLRTVGDLFKAHTAHEIEVGNLLSKQAVLQLARDISDIITSEIAGKFEDWEDTLDAIGRRLMESIGRQRNDVNLTRRT